MSIEQALQDLLEWARKQDFGGHDPHDLLVSPYLRRIRQPWLRLIALQLGRRSALDLHTLLSVPHTENAKALGLFISGLLKSKELATPDWKELAETLGSRLIESMHESGGWGYPFPWQSRTHYLPRFTPNIVTTAFAGFALLDLHEVSPSEPVQKAIEAACQYLVVRIPRVENERGVALGYAEQDPQIVFNASLLGAELLIRAGTASGNSEYVDLAKRAAQFVMHQQRPDGSWLYGLESSQKWVDSFHTGFVIVSLRSIANDTGDTKVQQAADRGFEYYRSAFLEPDFAIRYFPTNRYPIDAHAIGQALVTFSHFGDLETAEKIAAWAFDNMRSPSGYFYYQRHRLFTNRIPYMRWSNAWMFRGLSELVGKGIGE